MGKDGFKYLSQEFHRKALDLVKKKGIGVVLKSLKKIFAVLQQGENLVIENEHVLKIWDRFEVKTMKNYHELYF